MIENMAKGNKLKSYKVIPTRMQYWAAGGFFSDTIRFPLEHRKSVQHLQEWATAIEIFGLDAY